MNRNSRIGFGCLLPIGILVILGVVIFGLNLMKPKPEKGEQAPPGQAIFTAPVELTDLQLTVVTQGDVKPRREISISPNISGRVSYVAPSFIDGGFVRKGETLVKIEDADYKLGKIRAQSQVASAAQALEQEKALGDIARQDWEELGTGEPTPLALREPQLAEAEAALSAAKAQLRDAELALERTVIRAPFDGRIRSKAVDVGQFVSTGQSLGMMFGTDAAEVALPLTDAELGRLGLNIAFEESKSAPGPKVILSADIAGKKRYWEGRITRTSAAIDPQTRQVSAIATVEDPFGAGADGDAPLPPGLFVTAVIEGQTIPNILKAPRSALRGTDKVYVADAEAKTLHINTVDVIYTDPDGLYMRSGIEPGELVVTSPVQAAFDGMAITLANNNNIEDDTSSTDETTDE